MEIDNKNIIEENLIYIEDICPELLDLFGIISQISVKYLSSIRDFVDDEEQLEFDKINVDDSINLVREYLSSIDKKYCEEFDMLLRTGVFDIYLPEDDYFEHPEGALTTPKPQAEIFIPITYSLLDTITIIHEFFHYTNDVEDELIGSREVFTEMISIYFEFRFMEFLIKKGYDSLNMDKLVYDRLNATFDSANNLSFNSCIFDIYHNTGNINKENIKFVDKFRDAYEKNTEYILDYYEDSEQLSQVKYFINDLGYVIGTLLVINALKEPEISDIRMNYINKNISKLSFYDILNILDVKIEEYPNWIMECYLKLEEAVGKIYEEDNLYSGSNGYWKN